MTYRVVVTVFLSTVIALSAVAQQGNSSSRSQQQQSPGDFWEGDEPGAAWLIFHPFASKGYVQRHVGAIQDQVDEISEVNASNAKATRDLDTTTRQRIQLASAKTEEGEQHATDASTKAQQAQQTITATNARLVKAETVVGNLDQYTATTEAVIHFRPGQTVLSKDAKRALDDMATQLKGQRSYVIEVHGFSAGQGQAAIAASRKMTDAVARYLVLNHQIPAFRIRSLALGNAPVSPKAQEREAAHKRVSRNRVEVSVLRNDMQFASAQDPGTPSN